MQPLGALFRVGARLDACVTPPLHTLLRRNARLGLDQGLRQVADHARGHAVRDEAEVPHPVAVAQVCQVAGDGLGGAGAVAGTDHSGQGAEGALAVVAPAVDVVGKDDLGGEVQVKGQTVEVRGRGRVQGHRVGGCVGDRLAADIRVLEPRQGADRRQVRLPGLVPSSQGLGQLAHGRLPLVEDHGVQALLHAGRPHELLTDVGQESATSGDVAVGQSLLHHATQSQGRDQLAPVDHGQSKEARLAREQTRQDLLPVELDEGVLVLVKGRSQDLLRAVVGVPHGEVVGRQLAGVVRCGDQAQAVVQGAHRRDVAVHVIETLAPHDGLGAFHVRDHGVRADLALGCAPKGAQLTQGQTLAALKGVQGQAFTDPLLCTSQVIGG